MTQEDQYMNAKQLCKIIPGRSKSDARRVYLALERHFRHLSRSTPDACPHCKPYQNYGVLHISGNYLQHIAQITNDNKQVIVGDVAVELDILEQDELLVLEEIAPRKYCITFLHILQYLLQKENVA